MIGVYDYTVLLTYLSLLSACAGIFLSLAAERPEWAVLCLLFSGLCDAFDGRVARTKKNRTETARSFGVQIDSLNDVVAFGVLPAAIGAALVKGSGIHPLFYLPLLLLPLAALIRLAWFNVLEEERQKTGGGTVKYYTGVPVTAASLLFPTVAIVGALLGRDCAAAYSLFALLTSFLFVAKISVRKPGLWGILIMILIAVAEVAALILSRIL